MRKLEEIGRTENEVGGRKWLKTIECLKVVKWMKLINSCDFGLN